MALLLAPYNDAMRLGMGFTQQLCVNDAVQKPGGVPATPQDLIASSAADEKGLPAPGVPEYKQFGEKTPHGFPKMHGGTFLRTHEDGSQADISQIVTWKSTFVNNISEVTEGMDIKGSLAIKIDAIGGGAKASASYLNTETFKKSDINYHLQVNVINQRLIGENLTEFMPIKNVQSNQFQDVYGDCFISGFLEGGVFNAVISIELEDKNAVKNFGGELAIQAKFAGGAVEVEGSGAGKKETSDKSNNDKITVSVSWSGGGDIVTQDVVEKGWTIDTLKAVAISFADKVAVCPQKTSAILTKYSGLRSYYEKNVLGSPLDYENAGVYSSALLDAYMDYKSAWKELQGMSFEVNKGMAILNKAQDQPEAKLIADAATKSYDEQVKEYNDSIQTVKEQQQTSLVRYDSSQNKKDHRKISKPLPPNQLITYPASVYGLDQAQRDCRFEMIKIVREVDAVTEDPQVAVDPTRNNQFLSPIIFRQLIPYAEKVDPVAMRKKIDELDHKLATTAKELAEANEKLLSVTAEKEALVMKLGVAESDLRTVSQQRDGFKATNDTLLSQVEDAENLTRTIAQERDARVSELESKKSALDLDLTDANTTINTRDNTISTLNSQLDVFKEGNKEVQQLSDLIHAKDADLSALQARFDQEVKARAEVVSERDVIKGQYNEASKAKADLIVERDNLKKKAEPQFEAKNNLGAGWHNREVAIVNMASMDGGHSGICVDAGGNGGAYVHGWNYDYQNNWQKLKLQKVTPDSPTSIWYIRGNQDGWFWGQKGSGQVKNTSATAVVEGGSYGWFIEKVPNGRGYRITHEGGGCLDLDNPTALDNGKPLRLMPPAEGSANQIWAIYAI
ncbi:hypothetical protein NM208_g2634 [Fusarium decemcellulare]|uniref:Uncharacterized protein n=1 Tax=Fusarium decemcellulare TaxID=57161 RepID=A0ACC1SS58_9HYPO|nr:hypothetical protein NM208_g2634 [Fusarium decemcellulare]